MSVISLLFFIILVLLFSVIINNCSVSAQIQAPIVSQQLLQAIQIGSRLPSLKPRIPSKRTISNELSFPANAMQQLPQPTNEVTGLPDFPEYGKKEVHENVKAIIVTKRVPVPYAVHVERKIPYPVRVPVRRPFTVYVPKPYIVEMPKPYPLAIKVPMPQPYAVEKHIPFPVKIPVDKPYPVHISKPYPVFVEKKVPVPIEKQIPVQIKIPIERPFPVHIPVEKPVPYPVEKPIPYPIKFPVERPIPVPVEKPFPVPVEQPAVVDKPEIAEVPQEHHIISNEFNSLKISPSNFHPSTYDPITSSIITQGVGKALSFLPGSTQESYTLGTIHVPDTIPAHNWNLTNTDWIPKQQFIYTKQHKSGNYFPKTLNGIRYVLPDRLASQLSLENLASISDSPILKETHGIQYEPVKFEALKQEISRAAQPQLHLQQQQQDSSVPQQSHQDTVNNYQTSRLPTQVGDRQLLQSNYQFFNIHPQFTPKVPTEKDPPQESSISFQKFESLQTTDGDTKWAAPSSLQLFHKPQMHIITQQPPYNQQEKIPYQELPQYTYQITPLVQPDGSNDPKYQGQVHFQTEEINYIPTAQAVYMAQPAYQEALHQTQPTAEAKAYQLPATTTQFQTQQYKPEAKTQFKREEFQSHYTEPIIYEQTIEYHHFGAKPANTIELPQTNGHTGILEPTTTVAHQTLPATIQQLEPTGTAANSTESIRKKDDGLLEHVHTESATNGVDTSPITYSDVTRNFIRKIRRKGVGKKKTTRDNQQTLKSREQ